MTTPAQPYPAGYEPGDEETFGQIPAGWQLPHDDDAERAVLGAVMFTPGALPELRRMLAEDDFYQLKHVVIWQAALELADAGRPTDPISLAHALGEESRRIGAAYLADCIHVAPAGVSGAAWYAQIIADKAYARRMIAAGTRLIQIARSDELEAPLRARIRAEYAALLETEHRGWTDPAPLGVATGTLPEFPADALTKWVAEKVAAIADETQTPMDLAASVALAALATACAGKARVLVRPRTGWSEPLNLYTVTALPPGARKSPVFKAMTAPLMAAEKILMDAATPRIVQARITRAIAEQRAERAATAAAKAPIADRAAAEFEAHEAARELAEAIVPAEPQLVADDLTPEAAASMLADQGGRLAVLSAESEIFAIIAGRYSGTPSMNVFLKGHVGDLLRVNRRGRGRESVEEPALTLGICTQPAVLRDMAAIPGASERGLLGRFLYSLPTANIGRRNTDPAPAEPAIHATYATQLHTLTLTMAEREEPIELVLSAEAAQVEKDMSARYETRMDTGGDLAGIHDWASKAVGAAMRIAALLHIAEHLRDGYDRPITAATAANAVRIIDYYAAHALAAFGAMRTDENLIRARAVLDWIERTAPDRFTARQAFGSLTRSRFPKITDLDPALMLLERHGYIRRLPDPPAGTRGGRPPTAAYETHPGIASITPYGDHAP